MLWKMNKELTLCLHDEGLIFKKIRFCWI